MKNLITIFAFALSLLFNYIPSAQAGEIHKGELKGSKVFIALPEEWNKQLLILAHGGTEGRLSLSGDFDPQKKFYKILLDEGWMIASTSYRRKGVILYDAIEDIGYLREHVIQTYGKPEQIFIDGHSMGGAIGVLIAENHFDQYTGLLLIDPALSERFLNAYKLKLNYTPRIPIVYLCNQDEADATQSYLDRLDKNAISPGYWIVKRDGHVNVNDEEELMALRALVDYANHKPIAMKRELLIIPQDQPSVALFKDGGVYSKVIRIHPKWGNVDTELVPSDAEKLGIHEGDTFVLQFEKKAFKIYLGTTFGDVPRGEWIAFFKEDGRLKIARNHDSAVKLLGCKEGDSVFIKK